MSPDTPSRSTLADVLAAIETADMAPRRRQDMASAVRTVAKALGHPPERIPADPHALGARLELVARSWACQWAAGTMCAACCGQHSCWSRRSSRAAAGSPCRRAGKPCSNSWAKDNGAQQAVALVALAVAASGHTLAVTAEDLECFYQELVGQALASHPEATWADTVRSWNWAMENVPGWPQLRIERASRKIVYAAVGQVPTKPEAGCGWLA